jgi:hypothetical protein
MEMVNKFLDDYVGDTFTFKKFSKSDIYEKYQVISNKGVLVMIFHVSCKDTNKMMLFRGTQLCNTISGFFNLTSEESMSIIRDWFGDKMKLKKVSDLLNHIPDGR